MMKRIFKLCLFLLACFGGIYLSVPFLIETSLKRILQETPYEFHMKQCQYTIDKLTIKELQLTHKDTQENFIVSDLSCTFSVTDLLKAKLSFSDLWIGKIQGPKLELQNVTGWGEFRIPARELQLMGSLSAAQLGTVGFEASFSTDKSFLLALELSAFEQPDFLYEKAFATVTLDRKNRIQTNVLFKSVTAYTKNLEDLMLRAQGTLGENFNIHEGSVNIFSSSGRLQGAFECVEKILSYKVQTVLGLFDFLGKQSLIFEGKYSFLKNQINAKVNSYFEKQDNVELQGALKGDPLSSLIFVPELLTINKEKIFFPQNEKKIYLTLNPFSVYGNFELALTHADHLNELFATSSPDSSIKITGKFDKDRYKVDLQTKELLLFNFFKATECIFSLNGTKGRGVVEASWNNKSKTSLRFATDYLMGEKTMTLSKSLLHGHYRGTSIKMNKSQLQMGFDQSAQLYADFSIGPQGKLSLTAHADTHQKEISISSDKLPVVIFNKTIKDQNIAFDEGFVKITGHYKQAEQDSLELDVQLDRLKTDIFDETLGDMELKATLKSHVFQSNAHLNWGKKAQCSLSYTTKNFQGQDLSNLYHPLNTFFQLKGHVAIDGFSDTLQMHDDILSGNLQFSADKKENGVVALNIDFKDGYFMHGSSGLEIKEVVASVRKGLHSPETVCFFEGSDDGAGKIAAQGKFLIDLLNQDISGHGKINLSLFKILNIEKYQGAATGVLDINLSHQHKKLTGHFTIDNFLGYMVPQKESELFDIKIIHKGESEASFSEPSTVGLSETLTSTSALMLDIHLLVPSTLRFYGSGLESTWGGNLTASGPITNLDVRGELKLIDGHFVFVGKKLPFVEGALIFKNGIDPYIRVVADTNSSNIDAKIIYHGSLSDPKLELFSVPTLPKEEVLAQVMFSKNASELKSVVQALKLADAIAIFSGKTSVTGLLDELQKHSGMDEIGIREDSINSLFASPTASSDPGVLSVVKNLSWGLFVRGERTLSVSKADSKLRAILGMKLLPDVSLELIVEKLDTSSTGQDLWDYGLGFEWKKDY